MKKTMRESLMLLFAGQMESCLWQGGSGEAQPLSYQELENLRPLVSASSWRGAMAKAVLQRFVVKRLKKGKVGFQLTSTGLEYCSRQFSGLQRVSVGSALSLLLLKPTGTVSPASYAQVRRVIADHAGVGVVPSVFLFPIHTISPFILRDITALGFLCCSFPFDPQQTQPTLVLDWLHNEQRVADLTRTLARISSQCSALIEEIKLKKALHKSTKSKIGTLLVSGMQSLSDLAWFEMADEQIAHEVVQLVRGIDAVMREYWLKSQKE